MAISKPKTKSLRSAFDLKCSLLDSAWLRLREKKYALRAIFNYVVNNAANCARSD